MSLSPPEDDAEELERLKAEAPLPPSASDYVEAFERETHSEHVTIGRCAARPPARPPPAAAQCAVLRLSLDAGR